MRTEKQNTEPRKEAGPVLWALESAEELKTQDRESSGGQNPPHGKGELASWDWGGLWNDMEPGSTLCAYPTI